MRILTTIAICLLIAGVATAEKPFYETQHQTSRIPCGLTSVVYDWNFAEGDQGFTTQACDAQGVPVWEHGITTYVDGAPGAVWATVLNGDYPTDGGEALLPPPFTVTEETYLLEFYHYYDLEHLWDGANVKVNGILQTPNVGYPGMISVPQDWTAWCVDWQMGFTGLDSGWYTPCYDLSAFMGQTVQVSFEFGSDDTFTEAGWYLAWVKVGNDAPVINEGKTWSGIKSIYR